MLGRLVAAQRIEKYIMLLCTISLEKLNLFPFEKEIVSDSQRYI